MLYGQASIVDANIANGQVLLTITDQAVQIDGTVTVLQVVNLPGVTMQGAAHLSIPLGSGGAEGDVSLNVNYIGLVTLQTDFQFAVYSATAWAISGNVTAHVFGTFDATGDLSVSPAGFLVEGSVDGSYTIWIATITGGFSAKVWYFQGGSWGAYVAFDISASVLDGAVSATGTLAGALVSSSQGPIIFASADLKVDYTLGSWEGTVWVQFQNGNLSAGFGDDPAMDAAIAAAQQEAQNMVNQAQQVQGAIASAKASASQIAIPLDSLAAAYNRIANQSALQFIFGGIGGEYLAYETNVMPASAQTYFSTYLNILTQTGAPADTQRIDRLADSVVSELTTIQTLLPGVQQQLSAIQNQTAQLARTPIPAPPAGSPATVALVTDSKGHTLPTFRLNATAAQQQAQAASQGVAQATAYTQQVQQQVQALEIGLAQAHAATGGAGGSSLLTFVQRYDTVERMSEEQFARQVDLLLGRRNWARQQDQWLESQASTIDQVFKNETAGMLAANNYVGVVELAEHRVHYWALVANYDTTQWHLQTALAGANNPVFKSWADTAGMALYYYLGDAGLKSMDQTTDSAYRALTQTAASHLATVRALHAQTSQSLNQLAQAQGDLTGRLYDVYNRYLYWKSQPSVATVAAAHATALARVTGTVSSGLTGFTATGLPASTSSTATGGSAAPASGAGTGTGAAAAAAAASGAPRSSTLPGGAASGSVATANLSSAGGSSVLTGIAQTPNLDDPAAVQSRMTELGNEMAVPRITGIQLAAGNATSFMTQIQFTWTATHPTGISEYLFNDAQGASSVASTHYSNGSSNARALWLYTTNPDQSTTVSGTFQAGARGTAGYTGFGSTPYSAAFGALVHGVGSTTVVTGGGVAADSTPPTKPYVWIPTGDIVTGSDGKPRQWSSDPGNLEVQWTSIDNESGISEYDYAITTGSAAPSSWTNAGGRSDVTIPGLHLSAGTPTYVSARAKNGQGLTSAVGASWGVYYDGTPPQWAAGATLAPPQSAKAYGPTQATVSVTPVRVTLGACAVSLPPFPTFASGGSSAQVVAASGTNVGVVGSGGWNGGMAASLPPATMGSGATPPTLLLALPAATDPESGVRDYWWRVDRTPDSAFTSTGWTQVQPGAGSFTVSGSPLDYQHSFYVSVVARNHAGATSVALVYGPFTVADPSPPSQAGFCGGMGGLGYLSAQLTTPATDQETGVSGYQYRVRDAASGAVLRDWPSTSIDWPGGKAGSAYSTGTLNLAGGHQYDLDVRAFNWQNQAGDVVASGPIAYDATPPPPPSAAAAVNATGISVNLNVPNDPESGLWGLQIAVGKTATSDDVVAWQNVIRIVPGAQVVTLTTPLLTIGTYYVLVRSVNLAGVPSTLITTTLTISPQLPGANLPAGRIP